MKTQTPHFKWKPTLVIGTRSWSITVASVAPRVRVMVQITSANGTTFFSVPLTKHTKSASELNSQGKESTRPGASPAGKLERWDQVKKWCFSIVNQFHPTLLITKYNAMMLWNQFHPIFFSQLWMTPGGSSTNDPMLKPNSSEHSSCTLFSVLFKTQNCLFTSMAMTKSERWIWALQCNLGFNGFNQDCYPRIRFFTRNQGNDCEVRRCSSWRKKAYQDFTSSRLVQYQLLPSTLLNVKQEAL